MSGPALNLRGLSIELARLIDAKWPGLVPGGAEPRILNGFTTALSLLRAISATAIDNGLDPKQVDDAVKASVSPTMTGGDETAAVDVTAMMWVADVTLATNRDSLPAWFEGWYRPMLRRAANGQMTARDVDILWLVVADGKTNER